MSDNVGLSTPRGSGTSGYVQRNLAHIKPRDHAAPYPKDKDMRLQQRQPDKGILEHDRKREIEVKVFDLRDQLEEEEVDEDEIEERCDALRKKLLAEMNSGKNSDVPRRQFKQHQVHAMADAKIKESERLRRALKISSDYEEGDHWRKQEERLKESVPRVDEKKEDEARARDEDSRDDGSRSDDSRDDDSRDDEDGEEKEEGEIKDSRG